MASSFDKIYHIRYNRYGRSDYEIYKEDKSIGMVYEFKVCSQLKDAEKFADGTIAQIHRKKYDTRM